MAQITASTEAADTSLDDALTMSEWRAAMDALRSDLEFARSNCRICPVPG